MTELDINPLTGLSTAYQPFMPGLTYAGQDWIMRLLGAIEDTLVPLPIASGDKIIHVDVSHDDEHPGCLGVRLVTYRLKEHQRWLKVELVNSLDAMGVLTVVFGNRVDAERVARQPDIALLAPSKLPGTMQPSVAPGPEAA